MLLITRRLGLILVLLGLAICGPSSGHAAVITLTDLNSTVNIDPESSSGVYDWVVDGTDQMYQQWFWYRVGTSGPELSIDTLGTPHVFSTSTYAESTYTGNQFTLSVKYTLTGGTTGSHTSDLAETVRIINTSRDALDFHFFQYSDFDLDGTPGDDTLYFRNANSVAQRGESTVFTETVVTPFPSHHEGSQWPTLLNSLNDNDPTTLSDLPAIGGGSITGDVVWGFQWDVTIAPGGTFIISKDKNLRAAPVPEPCTLIVWSGLGGLGLLLARRRRQRLAA